RDGLCAKRGRYDGSCVSRPASKAALKQYSNYVYKRNAILTLPPTGGNAGAVGYGRRGVTCGWTLCPAPGHGAVARKGGPGDGVRPWPSMRSATSLSHRHKRIEREGHVMIRRFGSRGLAVGLFAACAAMVAAPAAQADPTGDMSALTAVRGQGTGMVIVS